MTLVNLICPHCGGNFEMDPNRPLQSFWVCPYCGNRSLMQKNDDSIRLRGIIPGRSAQYGQGLPGVTIQLSTEANPDDGPSTAALPVEPVTMPSVESEKAVVAVPSAEPAKISIPDAAHPQHARSLEEIIAEASSQPMEPVAEPAIEPVARPIPQDLQPAGEMDRLCKLAEDAASKHDYPLFNAYSRQAIDCLPTDPRMYALRAELTEEADGFARATWSSLGWSLLTPRRKTALVAQHFYNLNTALKYGKMSQQYDLINRFAWQLVRQAIDAFTEQGEIRCQNRVIFKTFKGRFTRRDLQASVYLLEALRLITKQTCPISHQELADAIRNEIRKAPKRIARRLRRY